MIEKEVRTFDLEGSFRMFPSPCGEMIEKGYATSKYEGARERVFPSPCGEMIEKARLWGLLQAD